MVGAYKDFFFFLTTLLFCDAGELNPGPYTCQASVLSPNYIPIPSIFVLNGTVDKVKYLMLNGLICGKF